MNKATILFLLCLLCAGIVYPQGMEANLLGTWYNNAITISPFYNQRYNEVWGFAHNGHEYGVIGSTLGMHFIDVTYPTAPFEAFFVEGSSKGTNLIHRDFKEYNGYLYCVADEGFSSATLQIIDVKNVPFAVTQVYSSNEFVRTAHNLYIDTSQARLYLLGAGYDTKILDITNPVQPVLLATYPNATLNLPYVHDAYIKDNIGFMNCGGSGLWVVDFTNPAAPVLLGTMTDYPGKGYNHSGWLSEDGNYYFLLDETHGSPIKVVDISNYSDLRVVATMRAGVWPQEIPHNAIVRGNLLYVSYYYDGIQVFDVGNPLSPRKVAHYDTYPAPNVPSYAGNWGIYPLLPSGNILASDMQGGFFVFEALPSPLVVPSSNEIHTCAGQDVTFEVYVGHDVGGNGVTLSLENLPAPANYQFGTNPVDPGSATSVTITNLPPASNTIALQLIASDGTNATNIPIHIIVDSSPSPPSLSQPLNNAINVETKPLFQWNAVPDADKYRLEVSKSLQNFDANIVYTASVVNPIFKITINLQLGSIYYWRITSRNDCGETQSDIWTFTTEGVNATGELLENDLKIFPNPANGQLLLAFNDPIRKILVAELYSPSGHRVSNQIMPVGAVSLLLNLGHIPPGIYYLKLASAEDIIVRKIIVQR